MKTAALKWFSRLRHSRGFGVHSPSAYRFIGDVLRQPCAYYAYSTVDRAGWHGRRSDARLLFRLAAHTQPRAIAAGGPAATICRTACPHARIEDSIAPDTDLIIFADSALEATLERAAAGASVFIADSSTPAAKALLEQLSDCVTSGHLFRNGRGLAIYVAADKAPYQAFDVRF